MHALDLTAPSTAAGVQAGVIFCSISEAVKLYPDLVKKYMGSVVSALHTHRPPADPCAAADVNQVNSVVLQAARLLLSSWAQQRPWTLSCLQPWLDHRLA
jgi:hypothetical protein